jgi:hypothetical protein
MEESPKNIKSPYLEREDIQKQFEHLGTVIKEAQKRIDYTIAHDKDLLKAIEVVERFLRKRKRVCYGGQAINSLLPMSHKFYDEKTDLPDYDFFTPDAKGDIEELIDLLDAEGYEVSKKVGIHEGTIKLMVNFNEVADVSQMNPKAFAVLQRRAKSVDGILYSDEDFLRMLMYLELSRPRGQVDRWPKVYERLLLLNRVFGMDTCDDTIRTDRRVQEEDRERVLEYCMKHKRVLSSPECIELMQGKHGKTSMDTLVRRGGQVIFFSNQAKLDAEDLRDILEKGTRVEYYPAMIDDIFNFYIVSRRKVPLAMIIQETACHAYSNLIVDNKAEMRIATPDLLLHLYYSILIFGKKEKAFFQNSLRCLIQKLHKLEWEGRNRPSALVPTFGLKCSGHQKGFATLLRERVERAKAEGGKNKTRKAKNNKNTKNKNTNDKTGKGKTRRV